MMTMGRTDKGQDFLTSPVIPAIPLFPTGMSFVHIEIIKDHELHQGVSWSESTRGELLETDVGASGLNLSHAPSQTVKLKVSQDE